MDLPTLLHLIVAGLSVTTSCLSIHYPFYDYYDETIYTPEITPNILAKPQHIVAKEGASVTIPCTIKENAHWLLLATITKINAVTQEEQLLHAGFTSLFRHSGRSRYRVTDGSMKISNLRRSDSGTYVCQFGGQSLLEVRHTLDVQYPPHLKVYPHWVRVLSGEDADLRCWDTGNPKPRVYWTYMDGGLPFRAYQDRFFEADQDTDQRSEVHLKGDLPPKTQHEREQQLNATHQEGVKLFLKAVDDYMVGIYTCNAYNSLGDTSLDVPVMIDYPPEIIGEKGITFGVMDRNVELTCTVRAEPIEKVIWTKNGEPVSLKSLVMQHKRHRYHILIIQSLHNQKNEYGYHYFGNYQCTAVNVHGRATASINITKLVTGPRFTSDPFGDGKDRYTLTWQTESYFPIISWSLMYRKATVDNNTGEMEPWTSIYSFPDIKSQELVYNVTNTLTHLVPASEYQVTLRVSNSFTWNESNFIFFTKEANSTADIAGALEESNQGVAACPIFLLMLLMPMLLFSS